MGAGTLNILPNFNFLVYTQNAWKVRIIPASRFGNKVEFQNIDFHHVPEATNLRTLRLKSEETLKEHRASANIYWFLYKKGVSLLFFSFICYENSRKFNAKAIVLNSYFCSEIYVNLFLIFEQFVHQCSQNFFFAYIFWYVKITTNRRSFKKYYLSWHIFMIFFEEYIIQTLPPPPGPNIDRVGKTDHITFLYIEFEMGKTKYWILKPSTTVSKSIFPERGVVWKWWGFL